LPTDFQALSFTSPHDADVLSNSGPQIQKMPAAVELTQAFRDQAFG
jgi:hypothetical protein